MSDLPVFLNTETLASLSEFEDLVTKVVRDVEFKSIGKAPTLSQHLLVPAAKPQHIKQALENPGIVGLIVPAELVDQVPETHGVAVAEKPGEAAFYIHQALAARPGYFRNGAVSIADDVVIEPGAIVAETDVEIGSGSRICSGAVIRPGVRIGKNVVVGPCTVLGADAYEVAQVPGGNKMWATIGYVDVADEVSFGSHDSVVASAFFAATRIGANTTFDNFVHVAHDCQVGRNVRFTACTEVSGRVVIGDRAYFGPNCTISNGVKIGEDATVTIGSVVTRDVESGQRVTGNFALPHRDFIMALKRSQERD